MFSPQPLDRQTRRLHVKQIADQIQAYYGDRLLALGVYGSVARNTDGPYSDIEMHCILHGEAFETSYEWSVGDWKAEVDVYTADVILDQAAKVDGDWPVTHGAYVTVEPLYDPEDFFPRLHQLVLSQPDDIFHRALHDVMIGEIYELIGKIRNARAAQNNAPMPLYFIEMVRFGACLIGLDCRYLYSSSSHMFEESLTLPNRPDGYDIVCRLAMSGDLSEPAQLASLADDFWLSLERWAHIRNIQLAETLAGLLEMR